MNTNIYCSRYNNGPRASEIIAKQLERINDKMQRRQNRRDQREEAETFRQRTADHVPPKKLVSSLRGRQMWERLLTRGMRVNAKIVRKKRLGSAIRRAMAAK